MLFSPLLVSLVFFVLIQEGVMASLQPNPFTVSITLERLPTKLNGKFDFTNNSTQKEDYYLSKECTPLEGIRNKFLKVTYVQSGSEVPYRGILVKRLPATKNEFILVKYGTTVSATVELTSAYIFNKDGRYKFEYTRPLAYLSATQMASVSNEELPYGGFDYVTLASAEINLVNVRELDKPRYG